MDITYFDILAIGTEFDLDLAELRQNFMDFQMKLHPDKYVQRPQVCLRLQTSCCSYIEETRGQHVLHNVMNVGPT